MKNGDWLNENLNQESIFLATTLIKQHANTTSLVCIKKRHFKDNSRKSSRALVK